MKIVKGMAIVGLLALLASCVPSLQPFFDDSVLIVDENLAGVWRPDDSQDVWTFQATKMKDYTLVYKQASFSTDGRPDPKKVPGDAARFTARLGRIDGRLFLDLFPEEEGNPAPHNDLLNMHLVMAHTCWRVELSKDKLSLSAIDGDWLDRALASGQEKLSSIKSADRTALTASTADLQAFLSRHAEDKNVFPEVSVALHRAKS